MRECVCLCRPRVCAREQLKFSIRPVVNCRRIDIYVREKRGRDLMGLSIRGVITLEQYFETLGVGEYSGCALSLCLESPEK